MVVLVVIIIFSSVDVSAQASATLPTSVPGLLRHAGTAGLASRHYEKAKKDGKVQGPAKVLVTITMSAAYVLGHIREGAKFHDEKYDGFGFTEVVNQTNYLSMEIRFDPMCALNC